MLHGIVTGTVKLVTPRGALMQLTDGAPVNYYDGLLRQRKDTPQLQVGETVFVKVVRIEPGLAIVDQREVDQKTGKDLDPFNELAEVEDWIDVPLTLVGRVIGQRGARIRQICEESGADLRFDVSAGPEADGQAAARAVASGVPGRGRAVAGGAGTGADLRRFLEDAKTEEQGAGKGDEGAHKDGADLLRFLEEARAPDKAGGADGGDLARFLSEARGEEAAPEERASPSPPPEAADARRRDLDAAGASPASDSGQPEPRPRVVEFVAANMQSWERLLEEKMGAAGVFLVYPERMSLTDPKGAEVDIAKGLQPQHFPLHVRYEVPEEDEREGEKQAGRGDKQEEGEAAREGEKARLKAAAAEAAARRRARRAEGAEDKDEQAPHRQRGKEGHGIEAEEKGEEEEEQAEERERGPGKPRPEAVYIAGAERMTKGDFVGLFELRGLPAFTDFKHLSKTEVLCIFPSAQLASTVLQAFEDGFDDCPSDPEEGPAMWRARKGYFKVRAATTADVKEGKPKAAPPERRAAGRPEAAAVTRLRINGDAVEVARAKAAVRALLEELLEHRGVPLASRPQPGQICKRLKVPADLVGRVIGKGGEKIRSLEKDSGARLKVLPPLEALDGESAPETDEQDLLVVGDPEAVAKAEELLVPILGPMSGRRAPGSPRASGVPQRRRAAADFDPNAPPDQPAAPRRPGELAAKLGLPSLDDEEEEGEPGRVTERPSGKALQLGHRSASLSPGRARARRLRDRRREVEIREYELQLMRQQKLDRAAAAAEADAAKAAALAALANQEELEHDEAGDAFHDWEEDPQSQLFMGRLALTPYGAGRVSRVVITRDQQRYLTVRLLAGGTAQAPEAVALSWLSAVDGWLGALVTPPAPAGAEQSAAAAAAAAAAKAEAFPKKWGPSAPLGPAGLVVSEAVVQGPRVAFRLVSLPGDVPVVRLVSAAELRTWTRAESRTYLVELSTTPASVSHIAPYRHDYRKARDQYKKGDVVILEGIKPGTQDVGTVRKVLLGDKGEKLAAALAAKGGQDLPTFRRLLWRCSDIERARRNGQAMPLEKTVLPLLAARLPPGAEALGVGASLDGFYLRLFVRLDAAVMERVAEGRAVKQKAAAASAALGALLGCETELLATTAQAAATAPGPPASEAAALEGAAAGVPGATPSGAGDASATAAAAAPPGPAASVEAPLPGQVAVKEELLEQAGETAACATLLDAKEEKKAKVKKEKKAAKKAAKREKKARKKEKKAEKKAKRKAKKQAKVRKLQAKGKAPKQASTSSSSSSSSSSSDGGSS